VICMHILLLGTEACVGRKEDIIILTVVLEGGVNKNFCVCVGACVRALVRARPELCRVPLLSPPRAKVSRR